MPDHVRDPVPSVLARDLGLFSHAAEGLLRLLLDESRELSVDVPLKAAPRRVLDVSRHPRHLDRLAVVPGDVPTAVRHANGVVDGGFVQVPAMNPSIGAAVRVHHLGIVHT